MSILSEKVVQEDAVVLTAKAVEKVKEFLKEENKEGSGLRISVAGGGCSGFSYQLALDGKPEKDDHVFTTGDVSVFVDPNSFNYLKGTVVDFKETALGGGFAFENPNASGGCGCGKSFEV